eukprot:TRINITY_DN27415_c0_g1_i1.p1 TRINITY_DN27415_c0_g1~~TRINITY_DN27415_c0_g1_i1.p1  ORF type:complete len:187 (+),score=15.70 TRINITY_DN27415_c0_g1_i1:64-624(+)
MKPFDEYDPGCDKDPIVLGVAVGGHAPKKLWEAGLLDCMSTGANVCCNVYWCTPCMAGRVHSAAEGVPDTMDVNLCQNLIAAELIGLSLSIGVPLATHGVVTCPQTDLVGYCTLSCYTWWQRDLIRRQYNIRGDAVGDCIAAFFCTTCAMCQHHSELLQHGVDPGTTCCNNAKPCDSVQPGYHPAV